MALGQSPQALLTMLYRSTDRLCRRGAPIKNLSHSASFESLDKNAPAKSGTKHIGGEAQRVLLPSSFAQFKVSLMLRIGIIYALVLGPNPRISGTALSADKTPSSRKPLAKLRIDFDAKTHFTMLTPRQFHFVEGIYVGSPTTPDGLPPGEARWSRLMTVLRMALFFGLAAHSRAGRSQSARNS